VSVGILLAGAALLIWLGLCHLKTGPAKVTVTWSYDYGANPACSDTQASNCVDHFEVKDITAGPPVVLQRADNPPQAHQAVDGISTTFRLGPPYGARTIAVAAVGRDGSGQPVSSSLYAAVQVMVVPHRPGWCLDWPEMVSPRMARVFARILHGR